MNTKTFPPYRQPMANESYLYVISDGQCRKLIRDSSLPSYVFAVE